MNERIEAITNQEIQKYFNEKGESFIDELSMFLDKTFLYKDILSDKEIYLLCEIRRLSGMLPRKNCLISSEDMEICSENFREICKNVYKLSNGFIRIANERGKKKSMLNRMRCLLSHKHKQNL